MLRESQHRFKSMEEVEYDLKQLKKKVKKKNTKLNIPEKQNKKLVQTFIAELKIKNKSKLIIWLVLTWPNL